MGRCRLPDIRLGRLPVLGCIPFCIPDALIVQKVE